MNFLRITPPTDHQSEIWLLYGIALIVGVIAGIGLWKLGKDFDLAACLVVLTITVNAVTKKWDARSIDRMGQQLGQSTPPEQLQEGGK